MMEEKDASGDQREESERKKSLRRSWKSSGPVAKLTVVFAGIAAAASVTYAFTSIWQLSVLSDQLGQMRLSADQTERAVILNMGQLAATNRNAKTAEDTLGELKKGGADTCALAVAAGVEANAAQKESLTTREALTSVQRAFVYFAGTISLGKTVFNNKVIEVTVTLPWQNLGATTTKNAENVVNWRAFPGDMPTNFAFADEMAVELRQFEVAPKGFGYSTMKIPIGFFDSTRKGYTRLFIWGWLRYNDIFDNTPTRLSEFCEEITNIKSSADDITDPSSTISWELSLCRTHNCSDESCLDYKERIRLKAGGPDLRR